MTNANRLRGLLKFGESVLTTAKRAAGLYKNGVRFDNRIECRLFAEAGSVHFDNHKTCSTTAKLLGGS